MVKHLYDKILLFVVAFHLSVLEKKFILQIVMNWNGK